MDKRKAEKPALDKLDSDLDGSPKKKLKGKKVLEVGHEFMTEMFLANNMTVLLEDAYVTRTKKSADQFKKIKDPKLLSKRNLKVCRIYVMKTFVSGKLYVYVGKNQEDTGGTGRVSSRSHLSNGDSGALGKFRLQNPTAVFEEVAMRHLTKDQGTNPTAEAATILAFYFMQQSGLKFKGEPRYQPFTLINEELIFESWTDDFVDVICYAILKCSRKRFNILGKSDVPAFPNITPIFKMLGAKPFA